MVLMNSSYEPNDLDKLVTILNMTDNLEVEKEVPLFSTGVAQWGGYIYEPIKSSFTHHLKGTDQQKDINAEIEKASLPYLSP